MTLAIRASHTDDWDISLGRNITDNVTDNQSKRDADTGDMYSGH